ncbi:unnamed protein product [Prorocentrum cordatum]|uniref:Ricin B lectin domain-containing protein n=1 Tax=Prorocentrum cordatum TaxID=2364126 RepID=A0ABN9Q7W2_9DINO|nr:unnamed protein product [Polarella glacialis]
MTYENVVAVSGGLFPLSAVMSHGVVRARTAWDLNVRDEPVDPTGQTFRNEVRSAFAFGTMLQELYLTASLLQPRHWDDLVAAAAWAGSQAPSLVDAHWLGGSPGEGPYGWAGRSARGGFLGLRNPLPRPASISLDAGALREGLGAGERPRAEAGAQGCVWTRYDGTASQGAAVGAGEALDAQRAQRECAELGAACGAVTCAGRRCTARAASALRKSPSEVSYLRVCDGGALLLASYGDQRVLMLALGSARTEVELGPFEVLVFDEGSGAKAAPARSEEEDEEEGGSHEFFLQNVQTGRCLHTKAGRAQAGGGLVFYQGCSGRKNVFRRVPTGDRNVYPTFFLMNVQTGLCLHTQAAEAKPEGKLVYWEGCSGEKNKFWKVPSGDADGSFYLRHLETGLYLHTQAPEAQDGVELVFWEGAGGEKNRFAEVAADAGGEPPEGRRAEL